MSPQDPSATKEELSYETAREELIDVVRRLEAGGTTLEESLAAVAAVTAEDVRELAAHLWDQPHHLTVVGPFDTDPVPTAP